MAIQQIQKSSTFKPDMIGDVIEVTAYDKKTGDLITLAGVLAAYSIAATGTEFKIDGVDKGNSFPAEGYNISITHFEFTLDHSEAGDDE